MSDVIDLHQARIERSPHGAGPCKCLVCGMQWIGVAPVGYYAFECPGCHSVKGVRESMFNPPEGVASLECDCGNALMIVLQGFQAFCPICGKTHDTER